LLNFKFAVAYLLSPLQTTAVTINRITACLNILTDT